MEPADLIIQIVTDLGLESVYALLILGALRPIGLMFGFIAITFAIGPARMIRISAAVAISLPMWVANADALQKIIASTDTISIAALGPKEFILGYGLGLFASLPFLALQYAGAITDQFRGETDSGLKDGQGNPISTYGSLYTLIGFSAFMIAGGFTNLIGGLFRSYAVWPLDTGFPVLSESAGLTAMVMLTDTLLLAIKAAIPLLALLVLIELSCGIAGRIAKRFNFYENAFLLRNTAALLALPLTAMFIWMMMDELIALSTSSLFQLEGLFQ